MNQRPETIDDYFATYGHHHSRKAAVLMKPLHTPGEDPTPDLSKLKRQPFPAQTEVIAASMAMLDNVGRGILCGQMGVGKTYIGQAVIHEHANRSRRKGGRGGNYRALVMCPDTLILKWRQELEATIPGVKVTTFDDDCKGCKALVKDMDKLYRKLHDPANPNRWKQPKGANWYIIGRDQTKLMPAIEAQVAMRKQKRGGRPWETCPKCGERCKDEKGGVIEPTRIKRKTCCLAKFGVEIPEPDRKTQGLDRMLLGGKTAQLPVGRTFTAKDKKWRVVQCDERLWQFTRKPLRWAPARFIHKKLRRAFHYLVLDEVHEMKGGKDVAQANAMGKLLSGTRTALALTGTLIGGYAHNIFRLLLRFNANPLLEDGFTWTAEMGWMKKYGRIERTVTFKEGKKQKRARVSSIRSEEDGEETEKGAPGIMPALFGAHLIDRTVFLSLDEMSDNLPAFREYVGGPIQADYDADDRKFWSECSIPLEGDLQAEYKRVEQILVGECNKLLQMGCMKLLGTMLQTLLGYQDRPWDWGTLGYFADSDEDGVGSMFIPVVTPKNFPENAIYPKERALIDICKKEVAAQRQVWIYVQMTDTRDVQERIKVFLEQEGMRVKIMRSKQVPPKKRLAWIEKWGPTVDVIISHPQLVQTGMDFFAKDKSFNFPTIVFYETGYSVYTLRQAAARAWRLIQWMKCRVYYLAYADTMQQKAMHFIARKMAAATQLDGDLSVEGLTALDSEGSAQMALARSISSGIDDHDIARQWAKIGKPKPTGLLAMGLEDLDLEPLDALDSLPIQLAIAAETILDYDSNLSRKQLAAAFAEFDISEDDLAAMASF